MTKKLTLKQFLLLLPFIIGLLFSAVSVPQPADAQTNPQEGSLALEGTIPTNPPTQPATISFPTNGQVFTDVPINVTGVCPDGLLVKVFKNEVFAGSAVCSGGTYSITMDLFNGTNQLVARVFDDLDQAGPDSNVVTVEFNDGSNNSPVERVTITTNFSKKGAFPGTTLSWPILITNGQAPYAVNVDWGDGTSDLYSRQFPGEFNIEHVYEKPGTYIVIIQVSDALGVTSYLQLVAIANGPVSELIDSEGNPIGPDGQPLNDTGTISQRTITRVILWPLYVLIALIVVAFWFGKRYEIKRLRKRLANDQPINF